MTTVDGLLPTKLIDSFGLLIEVVLVTLGAAAAATVTGKMTTATLEVEAAMAAVRVQLTTIPPATPVHVQLAPVVQPALQWQTSKSGQPAACRK